MRNELIYHILLVGHVTMAIAGFIVSGGLAIAAWRQRGKAAFSPQFWRWQTLVQIITVLLGAFGLGLFLIGSRPKVIWHLLYGALALLTVLMQRAVGTDGAILAGMSAGGQEAAQALEPRRLAWVVFGLNIFLWAMYGRGLSTGFFGV